MPETQTPRDGAADGTAADTAEDGTAEDGAADGTAEDGAADTSDRHAARCCQLYSSSYILL